jgi:hypothetical protein
LLSISIIESANLYSHIEHWEDFFEPLLPAKRLAIFKTIGYGSMAKVNTCINIVFLNSLLKNSLSIFSLIQLNDETANR